MRRYILYFTTFSGGLCLLVAALLLLPVSYAQETPEYQGVNECENCHRNIVRSLSESPHTLTLQDDEDLYLADFEQGADLRLVTFPGEDSPRAFTADDVEYSVGSGRYVQRYLYEVDRNDLRVFPAEWNVLEEKWQPFVLAENWDDPAYDWEQNCAYCHTTGFDVERGRPEDEGVQCEACHGPGSIHAEIAGDAGRRPDEEELIEIRASIYTGVDGQVCGQCHARGTNANGLPYPAGYTPGQNLGDFWTLAATDDPVHWWNSGHAKLPNMQYSEWTISTHSQSLTNLQATEGAQAFCLTCHSSDYLYTEQLQAAVENGEREGTAPESLTLETAQFGITCSTCHDVHAENTNHNTFIAEGSGYDLCVSCHTDDDPTNGFHHAMRQMYEGETFFEEVPGIPAAHFTAEEGPDCVTCHMPSVPIESAMRSSHTFQPILPGAVLDETVLQDSCSECHGEQATPAQMQDLIDDIQTDTVARLEKARAAITESTPEWVSIALELIEGEGSDGIHNYSYTDKLLDAVELALGLVTIAEGDAGQ